MSARFDLRFEVTGPSEDGTLVALCQELPMIIAASSESELRQRIVNAVNELSARLASLGEEEGLRFLNDAGVKIRRTKNETGRRTVSLPVSVGA